MRSQTAAGEPLPVIRLRSPNQWKVRRTGGGEGWRDCASCRLGVEGGKESAAVGSEKKKRTKKTSARKKCGKKSSSDVPLTTASRLVTLQEVFPLFLFFQIVG